MSDVRTYFGFGVHRTLYPGDRRTSDWLAERFRALGLQTSPRTWTDPVYVPRQKTTAS